MARKKTTKERKAQRKRAEVRAQLAKDNARVPRVWADDPAWLRYLLRRTWEALPDDLDGVLDGTADEVDLLCGQVLHVLEHGRAMRDGDA